MTLLELAERCEAATGPEHDIDYAIVEACGFEVDDIPSGTPRIHMSLCPTYTASIDAALTLVPEDTWTGCSVHRYASGRARAGVYRDDGKDAGHYVSAATPALAICAAALRARAATE